MNMKDKELYDNTEANFNDLTIRYNHLEKVSDERMSTILDIEKYCIDEKEDLISGCEVCEDILKMIDKLKGKKYYIKKTYTKRQIDKLKKKYENAVADYGTIAQIERDLYKEVIEEVKDIITIKLGRYINAKDYVIDDVALDELLQILDKVKG